MSENTTFKQPLLGFFVSEWNNKLYKKGNVTGSHGADWFWDNFQIESAPKFEKACWYHIPKKWGDAVSDMINELRGMHPDIKFAQIKEKFCCLTVYFDYNYNTEKEYAASVNSIVEKYRERLRAEGVHPPKAPDTNRSK